MNAYDSWKTTDKIGEARAEYDDLKQSLIDESIESVVRTGRCKTIDLDMLDVMQDALNFAKQNREIKNILIDDFFALFKSQPVINEFLYPSIEQLSETYTEHYLDDDHSADYYDKDDAA